jgi:O-antigen ligase
MPDSVYRHSLSAMVAVSLVVPRAGVLSLMIAWVALVWWGTRRVPQRNHRHVTGFVSLTMLVVVSALASMTVLPVGASGVRLVAWFVLAAGLVEAIRRLPSGESTARALGKGAAWGATLAGVVAVVEVGVLGARRADAFTGNAIVFGTMALIMGVVAWWLAPNRRHGAVAVVAAVVASVLSGSRGGWLAIPIMVVMAVVEHRRRHGVLPWPRLAVAALGLVAVVVVSAGDMPVHRLGAGVGDITGYVSAKAPPTATGTSIGARFESWRAAGSAFRERPLLGVGWGNLNEVFHEQVAQGRRHPRIATFSHAHHQLLGALASGGVVGMATVGAMLVMPAWWFRAARRSASSTAQHLGSLGLAVVGAYVVFGQSEAIFDNGVALGLYALVVGVVLRHLDEVFHPDQVDTDPSVLPASPW